MRKHTLTIFDINTNTATHTYTTAPFREVIVINEKFILLHMLSHQFQIAQVEEETITLVYSLPTEPYTSNAVITTRGEICYFRYGKIHISSITQGTRTITVPEPVYECKTMIQVGKDLVLLYCQVWNIVTGELVRKFNVDSDAWLIAELFYLGSGVVVLATKENGMRVGMIDVHTGDFLYECKTEGYTENDSTARIHSIHWVSKDRFMIAGENCVTMWQLPRDTALGEKCLTCTTYYDTTVR
jgi:hypothetical protein